MYATRTYGTPWRWRYLPIVYAELTTSTSPVLPPKGTGNLPLAASACFIGILDVLRGNLIVIIYLVAQQLWGTY